jgi:hypothetical protein
VREARYWRREDKDLTMHKPWGAGLAFGGELLSVLGGTGAGASALVVGGGGGTASVRVAALLGSSNSVMVFFP